MNEEQLIEKLQRLGATDDHSEKHSLAQELFDARDPNVFEAVLALIQRSGLKPIMKVEVVSPEEYLGDVIAHMNSHQGQIQSTDTRGNAHVVVAMVPLANMLGYADELSLFTQDSATCTTQFSHYDEGPNDEGPPDTEPAAAALRA